MNEEMVTVYYIRGPESLTEESRRLAEDAEISTTEIQPLFAEFALAQNSLAEGACFSGPTAILRHAKRYAAATIVSFELMRNDLVAFPIAEALVPMLAGEKLGMVMPVIQGKLLSRDGVDKGIIYRHAVYCMEQYLSLRNLVRSLEDLGKENKDT